MNRLNLFPKPAFIERMKLLLPNEKDFQNAAKSYQKAIENEPRFWEARFNLANILTNLGDPSQAVELYKSVIMLNPGFTKAQDNLNLVLEEIEQSNIRKK